MHLLHAASELHPYSKTGGLADMVGALAQSLARAGHVVEVVTRLPRHPGTFPACAGRVGGLTSGWVPRWSPGNSGGWIRNRG